MYILHNTVNFQHTILIRYGENMKYLLTMFSLLILISCSESKKEAPVSIIDELEVAESFTYFDNLAEENTTYLACNDNGFRLDSIYEREINNRNPSIYTDLFVALESVDLPNPKMCIFGFGSYDFFRGYDEDGRKINREYEYEYCDEANIKENTITMTDEVGFYNNRLPFHDRVEVILATGKAYASRSFSLNRTTLELSINNIYSMHTGTHKTREEECEVVDKTTLELLRSRHTAAGKKKDAFKKQFDAEQKAAKEAARKI